MNTILRHEKKWVFSIYSNVNGLFILVLSNSARVVLLTPSCPSRHICRLPKQERIKLYSLRERKNAIARGNYYFP